MTEPTLYDKYGGFPTVSRVVHAFYDRVRQSSTLMPYFKGIEMDRVIHHQIAFMCQILGGPASYDGRTLEKAHRHLSITEAAFQEVADLLGETLEDAGMADDDVSKVMTIVAGAKPSIVAAKA